MSCTHRMCAWVVRVQRNLEVVTPAVPKSELVHTVQTFTVRTKDHLAAQRQRGVGQSGDDGQCLTQRLGPCERVPCHQEAGLAGAPTVRRGAGSAGVRALHTIESFDLAHLGVLLGAADLPSTSHLRTPVTARRTLVLPMVRRAQAGRLRSVVISSDRPRWRVPPSMRRDVRLSAACG